MKYYQAQKDNVKINRSLYSIKNELFTENEVKRLQLNTSTMKQVEYKKSKVFTMFGVRMISK